VRAARAPRRWSPTPSATTNAVAPLIASVAIATASALIDRDARRLAEAPIAAPSHGIGIRGRLAVVPVCMNWSPPGWARVLPTSTLQGNRTGIWACREFVVGTLRIRSRSGHGRHPASAPASIGVLCVSYSIDADRGWMQWRNIDHCFRVELPISQHRFRIPAINRLTAGCSAYSSSRQCGGDARSR
jgi:hypothetical protein